MCPIMFFSLCMGSDSNLGQHNANRCLFVVGVIDGAAPLACLSHGVGNPIATKIAIITIAFELPIVFRPKRLFCDKCNKVIRLVGSRNRAQDWDSMYIEFLFLVTWGEHAIVFSVWLKAQWLWAFSLLLTQEKERIPRQEVSKLH